MGWPPLLLPRLLPQPLLALRVALSRARRPRHLARQVQPPLVA